MPAQVIWGCFVFSLTRCARPPGEPEVVVHSWCLTCWWMSAVYRLYVWRGLRVHCFISRRWSSAQRPCSWSATMCRRGNAASQKGVHMP